MRSRRPSNTRSRATHCLVGRGLTGRRVIDGTGPATAAPTPDDPSAGPPLALIAAGLLVLTLIVAGAIALR